MGMALGALTPAAWVTRPKFHGIERLPDDGRFLLVGNHTIYGLLDVPFLVAGLWKHKGLAVRSLGDRRHWSVPLWRNLTDATGGVPGTRENAAELMRRGEPILVFPGGAREANKRRGEKYTLVWQQRRGFAVVAIEQGYPIVPFAAIGAEEMLEVVLDDSNGLHRSASRLTRKATGIPLPSITRGIGPTPIPRPAKLHFWFGDPIDTTVFQGLGEPGAWKLREQVKLEIESGIEYLRECRREH
jgi:1-acyl-sn-glycerol-3-phosphate acyltransferase